MEGAGSAFEGLDELLQRIGEAHARGEKPKISKDERRLIERARGALGVTVHKPEALTPEELLFVEDVLMLIRVRDAAHQLKLQDGTHTNRVREYVKANPTATGQATEAVAPTYTWRKATKDGVVVVVVSPQPEYEVSKDGFIGTVGLVNAAPLLELPSYTKLRAAVEAGSICKLDGSPLSVAELEAMTQGAVRSYAVKAALLPHVELEE